MWLAQEEPLVEEILMLAIRSQTGLNLVIKTSKNASSGEGKLVTVVTVTRGAQFLPFIQLQVSHLVSV